jgi:hypothetical protein
LWKRSPAFFTEAVLVPALRRQKINFRAKTVAAAPHLPKLRIKTLQN